MLPERRGLVTAEMWDVAEPALVPVPARPQTRLGARRTKRALDVVGAAVLLVAAAPVLAAAAVLIPLDSHGSWLYRQRRVGRDGRPFTIYKLRTMRIGNAADAHAAYVAALIAGEADDHGGLYKIADDPRRTRLGRFLRSSSFDELPQLVNVLRGEMSLVGPRPSLPEESDLWDERTRRRLTVKPGITGLWQVSGRARLTFDEMIDLDLRYAQTWTPLADLVILAKTPGALLRRETA